MKIQIKFIVLLIGLPIMTACDHLFMTRQENYVLGGPALGSYMGDACENAFGTQGGGCSNGYFFPMSDNNSDVQIHYYNSGFFSGYENGFSRGMENGYSNGFYDGYYHW